MDISEIDGASVLYDWNDEVEGEYFAIFDDI